MYLLCFSIDSTNRIVNPGYKASISVYISYPMPIVIFVIFFHLLSYINWWETKIRNLWLSITFLILRWFNTKHLQIYYRRSIFMGTCNTLRTTETYTTENFTLIQLEEERQKLKKKELLKNMLTDGEFSIKGQCAINLMMTKLEIINTFLLMKYNRSFIQMTTGRLKSYDSVCKKMQKKEL